MHELLTPTQMGEADRLAIARGIAGIDLMERAGQAVADRVALLCPPAKVVVVAGPGNNGGDGYVAARLLGERGYAVRVLAVGDRAKLKGDAAEAARRWRGPVEDAVPAGLQNAAVIVDALFGAGLDRPVDGEARTMIEAINASRVPVVAVDLPSGISGATGAAMPVAVCAAETVTFFRRKPGHLLLPGRVHCGVITVADIGIPAAVLAGIRPHIFANEPALWDGSFPVPQVAGHKYSRGHAVVLSGGLSFTGASRLAARGALRAGAGLVTLACPPDALPVQAAANTAVMVRAVEDVDAYRRMLADERLNAFVLGPGGGVGRAMRQHVLAALATDRAVVLDADALTSFADDPAPLIAALQRREAAATVITPHAGEAARLVQHADLKSEAHQSKYEKAGTIALKFNTIVVLKGGDTVVAAPAGHAAIAANAPPWLATAGTGDVLAGFIGGLLAQGMPAFEAAAAAVWLHGECGNEAGPGLISEDLPDVLPRVYRRVFAALPARRDTD
ncbi:MAG: NAD(P)H-hydrate dehydratase [Pseudorhodoplanes sp.]